MKEINFHLNLSAHDYEIKVRHAEEALWEGLEVRLQLKFRGREMYYTDAGLELIRRMHNDLSHIGISQIHPRDLSVIGKSINLFLSPLPPARRTRKWH